MFTRCPGCHTVHPLNAALLAAAGGRYRCARCNKVCNALESLFDDWPAAGTRPPSATDLPVLGAALDLEQAARSREFPEEAGFDSARGASAHRASSRTRPLLLRATWIIAALGIAMFILFGWAEFQGWSLFENASVESTMDGLGIQPQASRTSFRDLERIHLVSRELRADPAEAGKLRLSATIVNRAPQRQPFPDLDVILLDADGQSLARERFSPADYLPPGSDPTEGMAPQAYLPLVVRLRDPGAQAVGFELDFE